ncbi:hypothetical protein C0991_006585, partial [Blastosporella zonata]
TNRVIKILILYIISTGPLTNVIAVLELDTFAILEFNYVLVFLSQVMGAIYAVSLPNVSTIREANTDPGSTSSQNITRYRERTVRIMFKKTVTSDDVEQSFSSTTSTISDLHLHPTLGDLKEMRVSDGSVVESA